MKSTVIRQHCTLEGMRRIFRARENSDQLEDTVLKVGPQNLSKPYVQALG